MSSDLKIVDSMLDLIGGIPLVRLRRICDASHSEILVKPEFLNPSGSIKDRIAARMVENAELAGRLPGDTVIIEATTGNTGTALAFVAAVKGHRFVAYAPSKVANRSRMAIMEAYGCRVEVVDAAVRGAQGDETSGGGSGAHGGRVELTGRERCLELERTGAHVWWARQFSSPDNVAAHRDGTAREILQSTEGRLDAFVASVGTGGTLLGVAEALKAHDPSILVVGVEPAGSRVLSEWDSYPIIADISDGIIPQLWASGLVDKIVTVSDKEAIDMAHRLAEQEGIFCGMSSGANVFACMQLADELRPGARVVTILPDSRDRYLEVEKYTT
jgi:cysteine synthase A